MPDPSLVHITTRSGNVRVQTAEGAALSVEGGTIEARDDGTVHVRRAPSAGVIEVRCAPGTDVTVGTASGKVELFGALGAVRVATVSGAIRVVDATRVDVRTKSGRIDIGSCAGECRIMTKSSKVHVGSAGRATVAAVSGLVLLERVGGAEVKTISGKVLLALAPDPGRVSVHTVSGKVEVTVPAETRPATRLRSISGRIECECTPGDDFEIAVASVSGAIRVSSA
ncbi:MAG TPA: DUF4097 family beta strand repeat-containing protein [Acidimicrobiia bacterium]